MTEKVGQGRTGAFWSRPWFSEINVDDHGDLDGRGRQGLERSAVRGLRLFPTAAKRTRRRRGGHGRGRQMPRPGGRGAFVDSTALLRHKGPSTTVSAQVFRTGFASRKTSTNRPATKSVAGTSVAAVQGPYNPAGWVRGQGAVARGSTRLAIYDRMESIGDRGSPLVSSDGAKARELGLEP